MDGSRQPANWAIYAHSTQHNTHMTKQTSKKKLPRKYHFLDDKKKKSIQEYNFGGWAKFKTTQTVQYKIFICREIRKCIYSYSLFYYLSCCLFSSSVFSSSHLLLAVFFSASRQSIRFITYLSSLVIV